MASPVSITSSATARRAGTCCACAAPRPARRWARTRCTPPPAARLGIGWHETTADGALTLEPVFCLGLCAVAPSALLDGDPLGRLDPAALDAALEGAR